MYNASVIVDLPKKSDIGFIPVPANDLAREPGDECPVSMVLPGSLLGFGRVLIREFSV